MRVRRIESDASDPPWRIWAVSDDMGNPSVRIEFSAIDVEEDQGLARIALAAGLAHLFYQDVANAEETAREMAEEDRVTRAMR